MSVSPITTAFVQQYGTNVAMLLQQEGSRFRGAVQEYALHGKAAEVLEQFGQVTATKNNARYSDTPLIETPQDRRWCYPNDYDIADLIDTQDRLRLIIDPSSPIAKSQAYALGRAQDDEIVASFFGSSNTGENGSVATAFPSGQQVAIGVGASGNTGLNVKKLRAAKALFMAAEVNIDADQLFVAVDAKVHDDMLGETQATNLDYTNRPVLVDGKITSFMGFNFIHSERYPGAPSYTGTAPANRQIPVWCKSGVALGMWNDISVTVDRRPDKRNAWQVYTTGTFGATRLEEKRVVMINSL
jgi:hypothetical protein